MSGRMGKGVGDVTFRAIVFGARGHDDGTIDIGSTTILEGERCAPVGEISQFFCRAANRGDRFRGDFQALYDQGIQVALKYLGE
jgi:hypothetical protein